VDGDQMTFTRIQLSGSKIAAKYRGQQLTASTPYGNITALVDSKGNLTRNRKESAPGIPDNGFRRPVTEATTGYGANFLRWTTGAPTGFLGNPDVDHAVTGGKNNVNKVTVYSGGAAAGTALVSTDQFSVAGQLG
jgi:hypothetical protein